MKKSITKLLKTTDLNLALSVANKPLAQSYAKKLLELYEFLPCSEANVMVVIGGDGTLLHTLRKEAMHADHLFFYGINAGSHGFLLNRWQNDVDLITRITNARAVQFSTLALTAHMVDGSLYKDFAINEITLSRAEAQSIKMKLTIDDHERISEMVGDGILLATPQGSTAYNFACGGPILPLNSNLLSLTPISLFRPRRWPGAVIKDSTKLKIELSETDKRPAHVAHDAILAGRVTKIEMERHPNLNFSLLVDKDYDLEERILLEQFEI